MPEQLKWYLELMDKISGPAKSIKHSLDGVNKALKQSQKAIKSFAGSTFGNLVGGARMLFSTLGNVVSQGVQVGGALANIATTAMSAARAVAEIGASFVSTALDTIAFKDESLAALEVLSGSEQGGQVAFDVARAVDRATAFDARDIITATRNIRGGGFDERQFDSIFALSADMAGMSGRGSEGLGLAVKALTDIWGAGILNSTDLRQLTNAGIQRNQFFTALARIKNVRGTPSQINQRILKMIEQRQVTSAEAITAAMDAAQSQQHGAQLGSLASRMGGSLSGQLSNIKSAFTNFFLNLDLNSPGLVQLRTFLTNLSNALNVSTESGRKLQGVFNSLFERIGGVLSNITMDDISNLFTKISNTAMSAMDGVKQFWKGMQDLLAIVSRLNNAGKTFDSIGKSVQNFFSIIKGVTKFFTPMFESAKRLDSQLGIFGNLARVLLFLGKVIFIVALVFAFLAVGAVMAIVIVAGLVSTLVVAIVDAFLWLGRGIVAVVVSIPQWFNKLSLIAFTFFTGLVATFTEYGSMIINGLVTGIRSGITAAGDAVVSVGEGIKSRFTSFFGIHSPSSLMMGFGENISQGLAIGIDRSSAGVETSLSGLSTGLKDSGNGNSGGSISIGSITILVDAKGATDPDAVGDSVAEQAPSKVIQSIEEWLRGSK